MITQSVGVPLTAKWRSPSSRNRSGSLSDSECDTPDWSYSGAITHTSSEIVRAMSWPILRPWAWMPSSLVTRMRITPHRHSGARRRRESGIQKPIPGLASGFRVPACGRPRNDGGLLSLSRFLLDFFRPAHIGRQRVRHRDRAVGLLIGFHHRDQGAADRDARTVERVDKARPAVLAAAPGVHAARLELAAD